MPEEGKDPLGAQRAAEGLLEAFAGNLAALTDSLRKGACVQSDMPPEFRRPCTSDARAL
ncbi:hypothetical protein GCM10022419_005150 [Nonomuraea rosea]|uniref:Uncharacterized protein n=1 Tax=Nonomuraea rosea TaxID=638574 RepID=A0ABP6V5B5_9ACTN